MSRMRESDERIFSAAEVGGIMLRNRILRAAVQEGMADEEGRPTAQLLEHYEELAAGGIGGLITGAVAVSANGGLEGCRTLSLNQDSNIPWMQEMVMRVHQMDTPIIAQLTHWGRHSRAMKGKRVDQLSEQEIRHTIQDFIDAAVRADRCGFDGIELQAAHGCLLSEFLSRYANYRTDRWGGTASKRFRILRLIMEGIREQVPSIPIWVKINGEEDRHSGMDCDSAIEYAEMLENAGADAVELSRGLQEDVFSTVRGDIPYELLCRNHPRLKRVPGLLQAMVKPMLMAWLRSPKPRRMYNADTAEAIRREVPIAVIVTGGIHDLAEIRETILRRHMDAVSLARPLIRDSQLVTEYMNEQTEISECSECNCCLAGIFGGTLDCCCRTAGKCSATEG